LVRCCECVRARSRKDVDQIGRDLPIVVGVLAGEIAPFGPLQVRHIRLDDRFGEYVVRWRRGDREDDGRGDILGSASCGSPNTTSHDAGAFHRALLRA
jgi:hypothetical protein